MNTNYDFFGNRVSSPYGCYCNFGFIVSFSDKEAAKSMGLKWNSLAKQWCALINVDDVFTQQTRIQQLCRCFKISFINDITGYFELNKNEYSSIEEIKNDYNEYFEENGIENVKQEKEIAENEKKRKYNEGLEKFKWKNQHPDIKWGKDRDAYLKSIECDDDDCDDDIPY